MSRIKRYVERGHTMNVFSESKIAQILCLFFLFTFFGISPSSAQLQQKKEAQFTVGMILPLSGRAAEYGIAVRNGVELAKKNSPLLFENIRFVFEDSLYDGKTSITAYNKITAVEKTDLVLVWGHGPVQAVVPVAEIKQQPLIVISGQRDVANGKDYTIRFCSPHDAYAGALLRHIKKLGYGKIAVVKTEMGFLNDTVEALDNSIKEPGMFELVDNFQPGENDFQRSITKLRTKEFRLLGLFLAEDQIAQYLSRLSAFKLGRPIFGTHSLGGKEAIAAIQKYTDGAFFSANYVDSSFFEQYALSFGSDIQITWAANAYDFAVLTAELFSKASPKPNAVQIVEAYQNVKGKKGVTGEFSYMDDPENGKGFVFPVVIKTITKEGIKVLEPEK